jgi:hypothetical protein
MDVRLRIVCAPILLVLAATVPAQDKAAPRPPVAQPATAPAAAVEYRPPARGAPRVRVGGSTRSMARALSLVVLTPDHVGLAASDQPELFWYVSHPVNAPLEFTIVPVDGAEPVVEATLAPVTAAGIQRIHLADHKVRLKHGEEYQWTVTLMRERPPRLKEAVASGRVRVQSPPAPIAGYAALAQAGYWYDALADLRNRLAANPDDAALRAAQQSLLEQVGLDQIVRN